MRPIDTVGIGTSSRPFEGKGREEEGEGMGGIDTVSLVRAGDWEAVGLSSTQPAVRASRQSAADRSIKAFLIGIISFGIVLQENISIIM